MQAHPAGDSDLPRILPSYCILKSKGVQIHLCLYFNFHLLYQTLLTLLTLFNSSDFLLIQSWRKLFQSSKACSLISTRLLMKSWQASIITTWRKLQHQGDHLFSLDLTWPCGWTHQRHSHRWASFFSPQIQEIDITTNVCSVHIMTHHVFFLLKT